MSNDPDAPRGPYKLFDYYTIKDRELFYGRENEVLRTVGEILSTRLLVLFAPSGSGKSSLINAGVRPMLEDRDYATITIRLDCSPELAVKRHLRKAFPEHFSGLSDDVGLHSGLRSAYGTGSGTPAPKPLVIFLDQFEEFFTVWRERPEVRRAFVRQIARIKFDEALPVYVVLSLRDDYFVNLNEFREEIPSIFHNNANIQLRPLKEAAALRAIVEPARKLGLEFEPGLPELIVQDLKALSGGTHSTRLSRKKVPTPEQADAGHTVAEAPQGGSGATQPDVSVGASPGRVARDNGGVLPITLQIVCHKLWEKRPKDDGPITRRLYAGDKAAGGLEGADSIVRRQLDESIQEIPYSEHRLMRRLFRALMTADLTKRLRSLDDLREILRVRDERRLPALLDSLSRANVLREERSEGTPWYEFRHDYLVREVDRWLEETEASLRHRRGVLATTVVSVLLTCLAAYFVWGYFTISVGFTLKAYEDQEEELVLTRLFNPFGYRVTTGLLRDEIPDLERRNGIRRGYPLGLARQRNWRPLTNWLPRFQSARLSYVMDEGAGTFQTVAAAARTEDQLAAVVSMTRCRPRLTDAAAAGLLLSLQEGDPKVRAWVARTLGELANPSPGVLEELGKLQNDRDPDVKLSAAEVLGRLGRPEALLAIAKGGRSNSTVSPKRPEPLRGLPSLPDSTTKAYEASPSSRGKQEVTSRQGAIEALGRLGKPTPEIVEELSASLSDENEQVRKSARTALARLGEAERLLVLLTDDDPEVRQLGAELLGQQDNASPDVIEALSRLLKDEDEGVRRSAGTVLARLGKAERLVVLLTDDNRGIRQLGAELLGQQDKVGPEVIEALSRSLKDGEEDEGVRQSAAAALLRLGAVDTLLAAARGADIEEVGGIVMAFGTTGSAEHLLTVMKAIDWAKALEAGRDDLEIPGWNRGLIGAVGSTNAVLLPLLTFLSSGELEEDSPGLTATAGRALGLLTDEIGGERLARYLETLGPSLKGGDWEARQLWALALGRLGKPTPEALGELSNLLKDEDEDVRMSAGRALAGFGSLEHVLAMLKDEDWEVRQAGAELLGQPDRAGPEVIEALSGALKDEDEDVRRSAGEALVRLGSDKGALAMLKDEDWAIRQKGAQFVGQQEEAAPELVQVLSALLRDPSEDVRMSAAEALGHWGMFDGLIAMLKDSDQRKRATESLARLATHPATLALAGSDPWESPRSDALERPWEQTSGGGMSFTDLSTVQSWLETLEWDVRGRAGRALGRLGQEQVGWTDQHLVEMLQDDISGWRRTAGFVLAHRERLDPETLEKVQRLLDDKRPWVALAAWDALIEIDRVRKEWKQGATGTRNGLP